MLEHIIAKCSTIVYRSGKSISNSAGFTAQKLRKRLFYRTLLYIQTYNGKKGIEKTVKQVDSLQKMVKQRGQYGE